ncbi:glycosyltransferase family 4 protein [Burkholderia sp. TSV86]|uniref:glycosyltransferase family 4 protein n=1 Tax=Burkholderia sp. TSV86 TaxID=1385594 RepID=UPI0007533A6F|nr:glycosyltransferase family 1 protein [Burkholderia sp. TSV86]KVE35409.1 glycosyl transferase family 1 [Burkholderia sp. TSV86]
MCQSSSRARPLRIGLAAAAQCAAAWGGRAFAGAARRAVSAITPTLAAPDGQRRTLFVDVSIIASHDAGTGIQRVTRNLLLQLLESPPPGFDVRAVRATRRHRYRYADRYLAKLTGAPGPRNDEPVQPGAGDVFLGLDLTSRILPSRQLDLLQWRARGVRFAFIVYDLLPVFRPDWFTRRASRSFRRWLSTLAVHSDALLCISSAVANETENYMRNHFGLRTNAPLVRWFHLGANLPVAADLAEAPAIAAQWPADAKVVLMVGTVEPRKGHTLVLDAFQSLWEAGEDTALVIVGQRGWHVEGIAARLRGHRELGRRLFWLTETTDTELAWLYRHAHGLLAASEAEGFGLPLIEAATCGIPLFLRDIPVFREIAGPNAVYFRADDSTTLSGQLRDWLANLRNGSAKNSNALAPLTWQASAAQLEALIVETVACERR